MALGEKIRVLADIANGRGSQLTMTAQEAYEVADTFDELEELIAEQKSKLSWRPIETAPSGYRVLVTARPPEPGEPYVVCADYGAGKWFSASGHTMHDPVTHWMPLPEPPK